MSIHRKLHEIMRRVEYLAKDKAVEMNGQKKYGYLSEQAIKATLHPLLVEYGILFTVVSEELLGIEAAGNQKLTTIRMKYRFVDVDSGEFVEGSCIGQGTDSQDKGAYKATTGAIKYIMTSTFLIPTGDDPENAGASAAKRTVQRQSESGRKQDPHSPITDAQKNRMFALMHKAGKTADQVKAIIGRYGYESSKEVKVGDYEAICAEIEQ